MKKQLIILGTASMLILAGCDKKEISTQGSNEQPRFKTANTLSAVGPNPGQGYELIFSEEFSGVGYSTDIWFPRVDTRFNNKSKNLASNVVVNNTGTLDIFFKKIAGTTDNFSGGGLITKKLFGYGYYEARLKIFRGSAGLHQSFWSCFAQGYPEITELINQDLLPKHFSVLELDGAEIDSGDGFISYNNHVYIPTPTSPNITRVTDASGTANNFVVNNDWVVIGYEWLPGLIKFYVDGVYKGERSLTGSYDFYAPQNIWLTALATPTRVKTEPYYWDFGGHEPLTDPNARMQVSYIKYWAKKNPSANLVANRSFEYNQLRPKKNVYNVPLQNPINWIETQTIAGYSPAASMVEASIYSRTGNNRLRHEGTTSYNTTTKQIIDNIPNGLYKLTAWVKSSTHANPSLMRCTGLAGSVTERSIAIPTTNDWTQITIDNILVSNRSATIAFTSFAGANEWITVDDVEFKAK